MWCVLCAVRAEPASYKRLVNVSYNPTYNSQPPTSVSISPRIAILEDMILLHEYLSL